MDQITITIEGPPRSKKNSRRNFGHVSLPSKAYEVFHESAMWQLKKVKAKFVGPIAVTYNFVQKGKMHQDIDNAICSINDVLQDAGIIDDDDNIVSGSFNKESGKDWKTTIEIVKLI
jgi:Holliday junction resolvase RusA-like endonuclease